MSNENEFKPFAQICNRKILLDRPILEKERLENPLNDELAIYCGDTVPRRLVMKYNPVNHDYGKWKIEPLGQMTWWCGYCEKDFNKKE